MTGLTRSVSIENLMSEIGWLHLSERRKFQNLVIMSKMLLPPLVNGRTAYNFRSGENISLSRKRTKIFSRALIPSGIEIPNSLPQLIRSVNTVEIFKSEVKENLFST